MEKLFILRHILMITLLMNSLAFATEIGGDQAANDPSFNPSNLVVAPVVLNPDSKNENGAVGAVVVEPTPQSDDMLDQTRKDLEEQQRAAEAQDKKMADMLAQFDKAPNAKDMINNEMNRLQQLEQEKHEKDGWFKSTNKRFAPESMTFFVAIGLVTYNSIWIKSHGDPLAMERHILSLKDPIAHLSFYAFMAANGFYMDLRSKSMDPMTKMQMMRRLSYQGMAIGSLASSIVSDLSQSGKMCVDYWIMGRNDPASVAACNQAWKYWTARNKFQQYFPQVIGMWASQAATELIDANTRRNFEAITATSVVKKALQSKVLVNMAKKITVAEVGMTFAGGTWTMKGIRWLGKLTQFYMFVSVDHALSPYTYRPINNLLRPLFFDLDALAINNFFGAAEKINWDESRINEANAVVCTSSNPDCLEQKILGEIENFGTQSEQWRQHLNSDAEADIGGWMEMTKRLLSQLDYSYKFYKSFVSSLFETLNTGYLIQTGELKNSAAAKISRFPFRTLPLYGVNVGAYKQAGGQVDDFYLTGTSELEGIQKEHIGNIVKLLEDVPKIQGDSLTALQSMIAKLKNPDQTQLEKTLAAIKQFNSEDPSNNGLDPALAGLVVDLQNSMGEIKDSNTKENVVKIAKLLEDMTQPEFQKNMQGDALAKLNAIVTKLKNSNAEEAGKGLIELNQVLGINSMKDPSGKTYSPALLAFLTDFRNVLGNPMPIVSTFAGHAQAFAANTTYASLSGDADFSLWSMKNKYMFSKESDLMTYKIFCGPNEGTLDKTSLKLFGIGNSVDILAPQFNPPRLLNKSQDLDDYCGQWRKTRELKVFSENLYTQNIGKESMYYFFLHNFNYNISGDYRDTRNSGVFDTWWLAHGRKSLDTEFKKYDEQFKALVEITRKNIFDEKGFFSWLVDHLNQSKYLKSNIRENLQFETNFYLQIISRMLNEGDVTPLKNKFSYLETISKHSTDETFQPVLGQKTLPEIQKVLTLFNDYYPFILQDNVQFDQYIAHSKKIDRAINDLLVLAGLKTSSKGTKPIIKTEAPAQSALLSQDNTAAAAPAAKVDDPGLMDFSSTPSATGTEVADEVTYSDTKVNPNLRQKVITAAVQGLRGVESEIRRFIRMKISMSQSLSLDTEEFMRDFNADGSSKQNKKMAAPVNANPYGQRAGG